MGIQDLQTFLDGNCVQGGAVPVDLFKIARNVVLRQRQTRPNKGPQQQQQPNTPILRLLLDGECCLDRLYGGYFSDWACGGQWNRMFQFLAVLIQATEMSGVELAVFFNGCHETPRRSDWIQNQLKMRIKVNSVLKHITTKGTPPPKVWWTPPACLRTSLRMALRHLKLTVLCSTEDHHQEVMAYCRDNNYSGLIADDAEYVAFDPPRYFSSEQLKLTYKGSLDTKEYVISELTKTIGISPDRLPFLSALLGNYILTELDLVDFYKKLSLTIGPNRSNAEQTIRAIGNFVKELPSLELDAVAIKIFGSLSDARSSKFRQSVGYYINGTREGSSRKKTAKLPKPTNGDKPEVKQVQAQAREQSDRRETVTTGVKADSHEETDNFEQVSRFASETLESEQESLSAYKKATANAKAAAPDIVIEPPPPPPAAAAAASAGSGTIQGQSETDNGGKSDEEQTNGHTMNGGVHNLLKSSSSSSSGSTLASPSHVTPEAVKPSVVEKSTTNVPTTVAEVMRTALERHQKGLMSPDIYQILTAGEIKLPVLLEDENHREFPSVHLIYRPVRQMIYAILFNLHHRVYLATKNKEKGDCDRVDVPDVIVKEWIWSKANPYQAPTLVKAEQIGWGVPTIQRLWFGTGIDDKRRRLRGFLTCMRSDTPLMLNTSYVPQHLLVMACVLRYIMTFSDKIKILRRQELDAFIAQAFSSDLMNTQHLQDLQLSLVTSRGVQLATLLMAGVETALLANDACGAPIPWLMCCPWLYFDGKLFHHTLARATVAKNLLELCGGHIEAVVKVERMRKAILEGVSVIFARPPLPLPVQGIRMAVPQNILPSGCNVNDGLAVVRARANQNIPQRGGLVRRSVPSRGGQLEIAGVVVGQWGANYGQPLRLPQPIQGHSRGRLPPQITSIGGVKWNFPRNLNPLGPRAFPTRVNNNRTPTAGRGKKTPMKATAKKKANVKKSKDVNEKRDSAVKVTEESSVLSLPKAIPPPVPTKDVPAEKRETVEKGQGDASPALGTSFVTV